MESIPLRISGITPFIFYTLDRRCHVGIKVGISLSDKFQVGGRKTTYSTGNIMILLPISICCIVSAVSIYVDSMVDC